MQISGFPRAPWILVIHHTYSQSSEGLPFAYGDSDELISAREVHQAKSRKSGKPGASFVSSPWSKDSVLSQCWQVTMRVEPGLPEGELPQPSCPELLLGPLQWHTDSPCG